MKYCVLKRYRQNKNTKAKVVLVIYYILAMSITLEFAATIFFGKSVKAELSKFENSVVSYRELDKQALHMYI